MSDPRLPVTILDDAGALARLALPGAAPLALLLSGPVAGLPPGLPRAEFRPGAGTHRFGCACCAGRPAVAQALDRLFQARVRDPAAWFEHVVAILPDAAARAELAAALRGDRLTAARFRAG